MLFKKNKVKIKIKTLELKACLDLGGNAPGRAFTKI